MNSKFLIEAALLENDASRSYSCVMVPVPVELADIAIAWAKANVSDEDVFQNEDGGHGRENDIHITLKYGLLEAEPSEHLVAILEDTAPFEVSLGNVSLFKNEEFDVLKLDVNSPGLELVNARVSELPNEDEHPKYTPHCTLAYVKKDSCDHLVGKEVFTGPVLSGDTETEANEKGAFVAKSVIFSSPDSDKTTLLLGKDNAAV